MREGWFVTSDLARMDDDEGYVYILGRSDDCFKCKGVPIVPSELEEAILALGAYEEACVFAIPDEEIGNRIGVAVVPRRRAPVALLDHRGLAQALAGSIASFKVPHVMVSMGKLPKSTNGKTQRNEVARCRKQRCVPLLPLYPRIAGQVDAQVKVVGLVPITVARICNKVGV